MATGFTKLQRGNTVDIQRSVIGVSGGGILAPLVLYRFATTAPDSSTPMCNPRDDRIPVIESTFVNLIDTSYLSSVFQIWRVPKAYDFTVHRVQRDEEVFSHLCYNNECTLTMFISNAILCNAINISYLKSNFFLSPSLATKCANRFPTDISSVRESL